MEQIKQVHELSNYQIQFAVAWAAGSTSACNSQLVVELKQVVNEALIDLFSS